MQSRSRSLHLRALVNGARLAGLRTMLAGLKLGCLIESLENAGNPVIDWSYENVEVLENARVVGIAPSWSLMSIHGLEGEFLCSKLQLPHGTKRNFRPSSGG